MSAIYDQHRAAFSRVSAYVITDQKGERVATIAFKFPADGAGRLYAYLHYFGLEMVRGHAGGYGYDKQSAALSSAASRLKDGKVNQYWDAVEMVAYDTFRAELRKDDGHQWDSRLRAIGLNVLQAV